VAAFPPYVAAQLHCHSSIEGPASIGAHCYEAARAGVDVVWLTDHDTRISLCIGGPFLDGFDFEAPELTTSVARVARGGKTVERGVGWHVRRKDEQLAAAQAGLTRERCYRGTQSLCLEAAAAAGDADWRYLVLEFEADAKIHTRPLLTDPTVGVACFPEPAPGGEADAEAWLDLVLSEQPPDLRQARLRYVLAGGAGPGPGAAPEDEERYRTHLVTLPGAAGTWTRHALRPTTDAAAGDLGGADNALTGLRVGLRVRRGARLRLFVDDLTVAHERAGNELHARQRELAGALGRRYGVVCHVAQEISLAGQHKNAWGSTVPLLDYAARPEGFSHEQGVDWVRRHEGAFSLNHPFSGYGHAVLDDPARERALEGLLETYAGSGASGADTLEVGFPAGRHGFDLDYYLRLWDGLSRRGVVVTGSGSSDAHSARVGWQTGNNFATRIRAAASDEAALLAGLRSGDVAMVDPILFRSRLRFGDRAGHRMGQVVGVTPGASAGGGASAGDGGGGGGGGGAALAEAEIALDCARPEWSLCWVVNGARLPAVALPPGPAVETLTVPLDVPVFVRAEIWDSAHAPDGAPVDGAPEGPAAGRGRCIALTNPIWYVPAAALAAVPAQRRAGAAPAASPAPSTTR
jgi:hypothetical protein